MKKYTVLERLNKVQNGEGFDRTTLTYYPATNTDFKHPNAIFGDKIFIDIAECRWNPENQNGIEDSLIKMYNPVERSCEENKYVYKSRDGTKIVYYLGDANKIFPEELKNGFDFYLSKVEGVSSTAMNAKLISTLRLGGFVANYLLPISEIFLEEIGLKKTEYGGSIDHSWFDNFFILKKIDNIEEKKIENFFKLEDIASLFQLNGENEILRLNANSITELLIEENMFNRENLRVLEQILNYRTENCLKSAEYQLNLINESLN